MSVFSRVRDIINSNINAMLDRAEDPAKLIRLMIQEMEDTLVEVKASCAGAMATRKKIQREREANLNRAQQWAERAQLAVERGREDLAREALHEKRRYLQQAERVEQEMIQSDALVEQYQDDILQLETKLATARDKQRMLVQRHHAAQQKYKAQNGIRRMDSAEAVMRFEEFENRIERMEAEADLVNPRQNHKPTLEDQFAMLEGDDEIERELQALKASSTRQLADRPSMS